MVTHREAGSTPGAQQTGKGWFTEIQAQAQPPTAQYIPGKPGLPSPQAPSALLLHQSPSSQP